MRQREFTWPLKLNKIVIACMLLLATFFYLNLSVNENITSKNGWVKQLTADSETEICADPTNDTPLPFSVHFASIEVINSITNNYLSAQVDHIACCSPPVRAPPALS